MPKKTTKEEKKVENTLVSAPVVPEKDILLNLYKELQDRNIRSISDLENLIAKAE